MTVKKNECGLPIGLLDLPFGLLSVLGCLCA